MDNPWLYHGFADRLADTIQRGAMNGWLQKPFIFNWQTTDRSILGPETRLRAAWRSFRSRNATEPEELKRTFEQFMAAVEGWPETGDIRVSWDLRNDLCAVAAPLPAAVANNGPDYNSVLSVPDMTFP
jgi:hypothetical protein